MPHIAEYAQSVTLNVNSVTAALELRGDLEPMNELIGYLPTPSRRRVVAFPALLPLLFAFSVTTSPLVLHDPTRELRGSGAVSVWGLPTRRGQRISLREARMMALRVMAETEMRLQAEREEEFRLFITFDEDEAPTAA